MISQLTLQLNPTSFLLLVQISIHLDLTNQSNQPFFISLVIKFIYSEKATKFCKISTLGLTDTTVQISQTLMAFSEYMNLSFQFVSQND